MKAFWLTMRYWPEPRGFSAVRSRIPAGRCATRSIAVSMAGSSSVGVRREHSVSAEPLPNGQLAAAGGVGPARGGAVGWSTQWGSRANAHPRSERQGHRQDARPDPQDHWRTRGIL